MSPPSFDTVAAIYNVDDFCIPLEITCNDDDDFGGGKWSYVQFEPVSDETYIIIIE